MTPLAWGAVSVVTLLILLGLGMPVAFSLFLAGILGFAAIIDFPTTLSMMATTGYYAVASYPFIVLPMFLTATLTFLFKRKIAKNKTRGTLIILRK